VECIKDSTVFLATTDSPPPVAILFWPTDPHKIGAGGSYWGEVKILKRFKEITGTEIGYLLAAQGLSGWNTWRCIRISGHSLCRSSAQRTQICCKLNILKYFRNVKKDLK